MTSELRSAVAVWWEADTAFGAACLGNGDRGDQAAAAVIEADREAVRAATLREVADDIWAVSERRQEAVTELAKFKALAETLAGALDEWVFRYYWRHEGMNTEHARIYAKAQTEMMLRQYKEATNV